jgi:hypothetical protein
MPCPECGLSNEAHFSAEMVVHLGGLKNLDKSGVLLFPRLSVCLDCGFVQFTVSGTELALLASTSPSKQLTMAAAG